MSGQVKLLIEIPEQQYRTLNAASQNDVVTVVDDALLINAIKNGTPLPENYGRLIDADAYIACHAECGWLDDITVDKFNKITPTIIPATKGEEE